MTTYDQWKSTNPAEGCDEREEEDDGRCVYCGGSGVIVIANRTHIPSKWDVDPPEYYNEEIPCECTQPPTPEPEPASEPAAEIEF